MKAVAPVKDKTLQGPVEKLLDTCKQQGGWHGHTCGGGLSGEMGLNYVTFCPYCFHDL